MGRQDTVAVIIPTRNRPDVVARALRSVTQQSLPAREIIIVLDGPCPPTRSALSNIRIANLRILEMETQSGVCAARNYGIAHVTSEWIAFLDDDDEWLPQKLEKQVQAAQRSAWRYPIVCSRVVVRTPAQELVFPRRGPSHGESIPEYLFCRRSLFPWEVLLQSSNLLTSRSLMESVPFTAGITKWDDTDWLMHASQLSGTGLEFIEEPLSVWNIDGKRSTISSRLNWEYLFEWVKNNRQLFPKRVYSAALLWDVAREAMKQNSREALWPLLKEATKNGDPNFLQLVSFAITVGFTWFVPRGMVRVFGQPF
jgi:glycosyltransferase involved in cell wall biosynthesis